MGHQPGRVCDPVVTGAFSGTGVSRETHRRVGGLDGRTADDQEGSLTVDGLGGSERADRGVVAADDLRDRPEREARCASVVRGGREAGRHARRSRVAGQSRS